MKKKLGSIVITCMMLLLIFTFLHQAFTNHTEQTPIVQKGYLDLTNWDFTIDPIVPLDGEWEFYPQQLLSDAANKKEANSDKMKVPGNLYDKMQSLGVATFRLHIKVDQSDQVYGLKTSSIQLANRVIVNGKTVGKSGELTSREDYKAKNRPYASYFNLQQGWNDIIVQVANYDLRGMGGINGSIYFGNAEQISNLRDRALAYDLIIFTSFLIMGLYFAGLYSQRKEDYTLIIFGLICIFSALYIATSGERVFYAIFPDVPFWLYYRVQMFSIIAAGMGFLLYIYTAFRRFCSKKIVYSGLIIGLMLGLLVIIMAGSLYAGIFLPILTTFVTLSLLYATYVFLLAALHQVAGSMYLGIGAIALIAYTFIQTANAYFSLPINKFFPFAPFVFLLMLALLMSLRLSNDYRKIQELSVQLLKTDKLKDEFLARTSHEFKSPLHGIMNISRSLLDNSLRPLHNEHRERVQLITNITDQLSQLVYDILDFSKLKEGELTVNPVPIDVHSAVGVHIRIYSFLALDRNIRLENHIPEQSPYVFADETRFGQIIGNLLDNAIKHTENGTITVDASEHNGMLDISIHDTGLGIDEDELPFIFEPFRTLDSPVENRSIGLGLPIVKELVELQNGELTVSTVKGTGTTFTFTLPIAKSSDRQNKMEDNTTKLVKQPEYSFPTPYYLEQKEKYTVLIADDNFSNLKILIDTLQSIHCNVIAVQNGNEAMEIINQSGSIDLAILDLMMPGMSGDEVCRAIRTKYRLTEFPVLMVTAAIQPNDKVAAFDAGANDFLPKPFDLDELKARISSLLAMKESFSKALDLEVAFLQSQIKPHFLYNALNSIVASSYTDVEKSRKLTINLADYLRGSFQFSNIQKRVSFKQELNLVETYVEIEKARFRDRIHVVYDIEEGMYQMKLTPLLIQPLVENAIRHGIGNKIEGGTVEIRAYRQDKYHFIVVADNGIGMSEEQMKALELEPTAQTGVGLNNINRRLKYAYGLGLDIQSKQEAGTKIIVRIPCEDR